MSRENLPCGKQEERGRFLRTGVSCDGERGGAGDEIPEALELAITTWLAVNGQQPELHRRHPRQ
jgi:hypothetical protein